ncbi:MAG: hypothetical protein ACREQB_07925, partial [Candidatus Binataceae bacterium]
MLRPKWGRVVTLTDRIDPRVLRKVRAGVLSAALHVGLLLAILSGGRHDGMHTADTPTSMLVLLEAREADHRDGVELPPLEPAVPTPVSDEQLHAAIVRLALPPTDASDPRPAESTPHNEPPTEVLEPISINASVVPATRAMSDAEKAALSQRLVRLAEESPEAFRAEATWEQDGKQYSAVLIRERANDGTALERVIARVSASDRGKHLTTLVSLRRLAFSQFTQIVDYWDPMVQLHDDEIVGRFHVNSQLKLLYDSRTAPKLRGKVTTAARSFNMESRARRRETDIFQGGIETRAARIELPESLQPFEWTPKDENARIHEFTSDAHIRFFRDGSYAWRTRESSEPEYVNEPSEHPVYFIAARDTTMYVQGVIAGRVLIYSPQRIVIEGNLTYASDPRESPDSSDYLGLVSNKDVEVAPPRVTGPGDLEIDAAIFAGRRFVVTNIEHPRTATLRIYGSLAAGSLTATEPRYATRIEYDSRFERQRPPGFPSTNRYEAADW